MPALVRLERTLTLLDHARLQKLAAHSPALQDLLDSAELVEPADVAPDVVTMNSQLLLAEDRDPTARSLRLCYPEDAQSGAGRVSVLSPVGASLLGARVGSTVRWSAPSGERSARIVELMFQPEAAGEYAR